MSIIRLIKRINTNIPREITKRLDRCVEKLSDGVGKKYE